MSSSSASAIPYIGSKISLITNSELRYEGTLININTAKSTVTLRDVRMSGTENRKAPHFVLPSNEIFDYIIFNGKDIKDLTVSEPGFSIKEDPAVVAVNVPPAGYAGPNDSYVNDPSVMPMRHRGGAPDMYSPMGDPRRNLRRDYDQPRDYSYHPNRAPMYRGGRGGSSFPSNPRHVVGELTAQPNNSLKTQVASAFDFETSNKQFTKEKTVGEGQNGETALAPPYDQKSSFFDNISCETLNRQRGRESRVDREKQREVDAETFGAAATISRGPRYYRQGAFRRPMRGGRPDNSYRGNYYQHMFGAGPSPAYGGVRA